MNDNLGQLADSLGLTLEEEVYYANYAEIDVCECCGNYVGIKNWHDDTNFLTWMAGKLYCQKCLN
jgi:hypothetical protein